ncbi:methyl-accepting chemotaxis protein [Sphingomonas sp. EC-HK361]|uniref:methyl-accepting chemotaxis protein n=1 Tax=Sphingomonas sp. EC-HK361 TaxID=2038397 RepID=UPI0018FEC688|nr:methyl-accepting chemotaxis protein [Sphingomonas sp. EC-HK361]
MGRGNIGWTDRAEGERVIASDAIIDRTAIANGVPLLDAAKIFRAQPHLRMLAVLDAGSRPVGAIYERDIRDILFSPYGYALLYNRSLAIGLDRHVLACTAVELGTRVGDALDAWAAGGTEGLVVTRGGQFEGVIDQVTLLKLAAERDAAISRENAARADRIDAASRAFEESVRDLTAGLADASRRVEATSSRMGLRAGQISERIAAVAAATTQASANMGEIADQGQRLAGSLGDVEQRMVEAQGATRTAVQQAHDGAYQVTQLSDAADTIGDVTALIDDIAQRTTMLALNASIEAARAGDAGRGFAVVADAVKALAGQTRRAAAGIGGHIDRIRAATEQVSTGHAGVSDAVRAVETLSDSVMGAIREQGAAGRTISRNVADAGRAADHVGENVTDILASARSAGADAGEMGGLARALADKADTLDRHLGAFLGALAAA